MGGQNKVAGKRMIRATHCCSPMKSVKSANKRKSTVDQSMIDEKNRDGWAHYERHREGMIGSQNAQPAPPSKSSKNRGLVSSHS